MVPIPCHSLCDVVWCCTHGLDSCNSARACVICLCDHIDLQVFGSSGRVDFWISLQPEAEAGLTEAAQGWAVELLCNGEGAAEHIARFARDGRYASMPHSQWAVVDFYTPGRGPPAREDSPTLQGHLFYIEFKDAFLSANVWKGTQLLKANVKLR